MQTEDFVTCEIAQALKREGFDWSCRAVWHFDGSVWQLITDYGATFRHPSVIPHFNDSATWGAHIYSAPTLEQARKWLRENRNLHIDISPDYDRTWYYHPCPIGGATEEGDSGFPTYEAALSAALSAQL